VNLLLLTNLPLQARDRNNTSTNPKTKSVTTQKLNQGKENRQLKPPTSQSRTKLQSTNWSDGEKKGRKLHSSKNPTTI
jgi:hypothetical protein